MELMEIAMGALRKHIKNEMECDNIILAEINKGPAMIRVASREELKIEINKYKNLALRLMNELKTNKIKVPGYAEKADLAPETGLR